MGVLVRVFRQVGRGERGWNGCCKEGEEKPSSLTFWASWKKKIHSAVQNDTVLDFFSCEQWVKWLRFDQNALFYLNGNGAKTCKFSNQSSICDLYNQVLNCNFNFKNQFNASLPNSNVSLEVGHLCHFDPWFWICAFWLSIDQQTFNFFNLTPDSVNSSPSTYMHFPVWYLVSDFFNQISN